MKKDFIDSNDMLRNLNHVKSQRLKDMERKQYQVEVEFDNKMAQMTEEKMKAEGKRIRQGKKTFYHKQREETN